MRSLNQKGLISYDAYKFYKTLINNKINIVDLEPAFILKELKDAGYITVTTDLIGTWYVKTRRKTIQHWDT